MFISVDKGNNSVLWRLLIEENFLDPLFFSLISLKDKIAQFIELVMVFTTSTLSFFFFAIVSVTVSLLASVFIIPWLALSFIFSGFVVVFSGLNYLTFRLASAKFNRTVLFLNRLLRKLADNIPPSVGFEELQTSNLPLSSSAILSFLNHIYGHFIHLLSKVKILREQTNAKTETFSTIQEEPSIGKTTSSPIPNENGGVISIPLIQ